MMELRKELVELKKRDPEDVNPDKQHTDEQREGEEGVAGNKPVELEQLQELVEQMNNAQEQEQPL